MGGMGRPQGDQMRDFKCEALSLMYVRSRFRILLDLRVASKPFYGAVSMVREDEE